MIVVSAGTENLNPVTANEERTLLPEELADGGSPGRQCVVAGGVHPSARSLLVSQRRLPFQKGFARSEISSKGTAGGIGRPSSEHANSSSCTAVNGLPSAPRYASPPCPRSSSTETALAISSTWIRLDQRSAASRGYE